MGNMPESAEYFEYRSGGIRVLVPSYLAIESDAPDLSAVSADEKSTLLIRFIATSGEGTDWERILRQPWRGNTMLDSVVIRERDVNVPYPGFERIVEHKLKNSADPNTNFFWGMALHPSIGSTLEVQITSFSPFLEGEEVWTRTVESIYVLDA